MDDNTFKGIKPIFKSVYSKSKLFNRFNTVKLPKVKAPKAPKIETPHSYRKF